MGARESVSACLITKNEERFLPDCLRSLEAKVDEIVIVDTGSSDRTVEIARSAGAKILHDAWNEDFSTPRNKGLDAATGDWILYIDADERLTVPGDGPVAAHLPGAEASAARLLLQPRVGYTFYSELRLFRNDPRIRFNGIMHERIRETLREVCRQDATIVAAAHAVRLEHVGYEGDQSHKHARNEPILRKALRHDPDRVYCWFHLAETLRATGRFAEAEQCLEEAMQRALRSGDPDELSVASSCCQIRCETALEAGDARAALTEAETGLGLSPDNFALMWSKGRAQLALGDAQDAIRTALPLTGIDAENLVHDTLSFDRNLFRRDVHALLGSAHFDLGDYGEAARCYERAQQHGDDTLEYRTKASLSRSLAARAEPRPRKAI